MEFVVRELIREQLSILEDLIDNKLPDIKGIKEPYIKRYNGALNQFTLGHYKSASSILQLKWGEEYDKYIKFNFI